MKHLSWLVVSLLLLGGCIVPDEQTFTEERVRTCGQAFTCPSGTLCVRGSCESAEAPAETCPSACAAYEFCSALTSSCVSRYSELTLSPDTTSVLGKGPHTVQASLRLVEGVHAVYPETLSFTVTKEGGKPQELQPAVRNGSVYTTLWSPLEDGNYQLQVTSPEVSALSGAVQLSVDVTGPIFTVSVPAQVPAVSDGGTTYGDPAPGYASAWRRDQEVVVQVRTNEPYLDTSTVKVALNGTDGSTTVTEVSSYTNDCDAGFCGRASLKLWQPTFNQFRGAMTVEVLSSDALGNAASTNAAQVAVTRWKWFFDAKAGSIRSTPAVGQSGTVYFGTTTTTNGKVVALRHDGSSQWTTTTLGAVEGGIAVGTASASDAGTELVYVGVKTSNGPSLYALRGSDGVTRKKCPGSGPTDTFGPGYLAGGIGIGVIGTGNFETAASIYAGTDPAADPNSIISVNSIGSCTSLNSVGGEAILAVVPDGNVAIRERELFYSSVDNYVNRLASYTLGSLNKKPNWPVGISAVPRHLALVESEVFAAAANSEFFTGGVYRAPQAGATSASLLYPASTTARVVGLALSNDFAFFGTQASDVSSLVSLPLLGTGGPKTETATGVFRVTPAVGRTSVYFVSTTGIIEARAKDTLAPRWNSGTPLLGVVEAAPTLDCSRDASGAAIAGMPGVLYVPAAGKLHAFIVDNAGLDPDAKWPKYQHDVRNTGNPATPITACP